MNWKWEAEGFIRPPKRLPAPEVGSRHTAGLRLFRAWGGSSSKLGRMSRPGVCFSTQQPATRWEAEALFSVMEYGNSCEWLTEFWVVGETELYVGEVDLGDPASQLLRLIDERPAVQVFIENPICCKVLEIRTVRLADDLEGKRIVPRKDWPNVDS